MIFPFVGSKGVACVIILAGPLWGPARHRALEWVVVLKCSGGFPGRSVLSDVSFECYE